MRKIITLQRLDTPEDVRRALKTVEDVLNRLANPTTDMVGGGAGGGLVSVGPQGPAGAVGPQGIPGPVGPGGAATRTSLVFITASLAPGGKERAWFTAKKALGLWLISVNTAARVIFYSSSAAQTADIGRSLGTPVEPGKGILGEFSFASPYEIETAPVPILVNREPPPSTQIYYSVTNRSLITQPITVYLTHLPLEN